MGDAVLDPVPDPWLVTDTDGRILLSNRAADAMLDSDGASVVGRSLPALVVPGDRPLFRSLLDAGGSSDRVVLHLSRPSGPPITCVAHVDRGTGDHGDIVGWSISVPDEDGSDALDALPGSFITALIHDLRSPLGAAAGVVTSLLETMETSEEARDLLHVTRRALGSAAEMLGRVGELESLRQRELRRTVFPLDRSVADLLGEQATPVERFLEPDVIVEADPELIECALLELIDNAETHTPFGTEVRVRVWGGTDGAHLVVEDDGPGVPDAYKDEVFLPLHRGMAPMSRRGSGLGLAFVHRIVRAHGGEAWVEDRPGGGASFHIRLPGVGRGSERPTAPERIGVEEVTDTSPT